MRRSPQREAGLRAVLWLSLGGWIGAWAFFAFVVSRIAFRVLPGDIAGNLAGSLLHVLHLGGAAAAFAVAFALWGLGRRGAIVLVPIALGLVCVGSELLLSPEVAALRPSTLGAANSLETQTRFRLLHGISLGLFMSIHVASITLLGRVAWLEARDHDAATRPGH
ncbi:DUF4149 domain-containing protein [Myxococcota bacterium]|nr:DUF4149 domain-containing protein [Myxococcota bacterium]